MRVCITGGAGFIGSHLAKYLKQCGHYVVVADWKDNEFMSVEDFCDEFHKLDLRSLANCIKVTKDCDEVYHLAADMGGMGFIQSNNGAILFNNTVMSLHVIESCRINCVKRLFYSSSACVYPEYKQTSSDIGTGLKEEDAWPAQPQDAYGLEKLVTEEMCKHYMKDFGMQIRVARFHNVYGPYGTWFGGREKAPAAICRKVAVADHEVEIWGDGEQTRSFMYIDDCVEGILRIMHSDIKEPINLGSSELVSINTLAKYAMDIANKPNVQIKYVPGPIGVMGRNSDNSNIISKLNWEPRYPLKEGLKHTYKWIVGEIEKQTENKERFKNSMVCQISAPNCVE